MGIDEAVDPQEASVATLDQLADDLEAMGFDVKFINEKRQALGLPL